MVKVGADVWPGRDGLDSFYLCQDVAEAYAQLCRAVKELGGVVTSEGSLRELTAEVSAGRSSNGGRMHPPRRRGGSGRPARRPSTSGCGWEDFVLARVVYRTYVYKDE